MRNIRVTGKPFPTSFDTVQADEQSSVKDKPVLDRRLARVRLSRVLGNLQPSVLADRDCTEPQVLPVLVAGTFGDYLNYGYARRRPERPGDIMSDVGPVRREAIIPARLSVVGVGRSSR